MLLNHILQFPRWLQSWTFTTEVFLCRREHGYEKCLIITNFRVTSESVTTAFHKSIVKAVLNTAVINLLVKICFVFPVQPFHLFYHKYLRLSRIVTVTAFETAVITTNRKQITYCFSFIRYEFWFLFDGGNISLHFKWKSSFLIVVAQAHLSAT